MNKQEAIEKIKNIETLNIKDRMDDKGVDMVIKNQVLEIISQIDEPQKVVVPKSVAEWIEIHKESFSDASAIDMYDNLTSDNRCGYYHEVWLWVIVHHYDFIKAWHDGYEIEQEKLYTVEIPNPHGLVVCLERQYSGKIALSTLGESKLTESEIKQNFEWAWQWAKEVEVE